jgi:hypothetical protein
MKYSLYHEILGYIEEEVQWLIDISGTDRKKIAVDMPYIAFSCVLASLSQR